MTSPNRPALILVSHRLCPYVQRAAIVLDEKGAAFEQRWVDLAHKPDWFMAISPLGKTPVLLVDGEPIFESAVICEYLDDTIAPRLHPADALARAKHRGWIEFGSAVLNQIAGFYNAQDEAALESQRLALRRHFEQLEATLETANGDGPYFAGTEVCIVDAAFAPVFRYFDAFETLGDWHFFDALPRLQDWRAALAVRPSMSNAVGADYLALLRDFIVRRGSALSARVAVEQPALTLATSSIGPTKPPERAVHDPIQVDSFTPHANPIAGQMHRSYAAGPRQNTSPIAHHSGVPHAFDRT